MDDEAISVSDFEEHEDSDSDSIAPEELPRSLPHVRPNNPRNYTEPTPTTLLKGFFKEWEVSDWHRPRSSHSQHHRNRSPYSRSHLRSRSTGGTALSAPPMMRAHSMPNPQSSRTLDSSAATPSSGSLSPSPMRASPARTRSPLKADEMPRSPSWFEGTAGGIGGGIGIEAIQEDSELDFTQPPQQHQHVPPVSRSNSLRSSKRPASPLHTSTTPSATHQQQLHALQTTLPTHSLLDHPQPQRASSNPNSPALNPQKYNEAYPPTISLHHYSSTSSFTPTLSSSHPSTPTSARSRSPSISSLDTIEDAPEQEEESEAAEALRAKLTAAAVEDGSDSEDGGRRRSSLETHRVARRPGGSERKRWSVCGGERRADLDLETIWED